MILPFTIGTVDSTDSVTLRVNSNATRRACEMQLGYVLLALLLGNETEARTYMDEYIKLQNVHNGSGGVLYVTATYAMLPWEFHVWESVVSSAWLYLLVKNPDVLFPRTLRQVYYMAKISNYNNERQ